MTKQKGPDSIRGRGIARGTSVPVADGSLQPRAPGWVAPGSANVQSANIEQQGAALRARGSLQGGAGVAQQSGWSARQNGQRMQARGEEERLNASRQSHLDGAIQQHAESSPAQVRQVAQPASGKSGRNNRK